MNQLSSWRFSFSSTLVLAVLACSSNSDQKSGGAFSSGLPAGSILGTLSDADWQKFCGAAAAYESSNSDPDISCRLAGISAAALAAAFGAAPNDAAVQKTCKDTYDQCKSTTATMDAGAGTNNCSSKPGSDCTATVSEAETCLTDSTAAEKAAAASIPTCESLTLAQFQMPSDAGTTTSSPESCKTATQKCPGLL
jgi:hypothetical protein